MTGTGTAYVKLCRCSACQSKMLDLLEALTDPDECTLDHHGDCQAHHAGTIGEPPRCPHEVAKQVLAERAAS